MSQIIVTVEIDCDVLPSPEFCDRVNDEIEDAATGAMIEHESYSVRATWKPIL